jgi:predicted alpha/beta-hydrolase family hydrolase
VDLEIEGGPTSGIVYLSDDRSGTLLVLAHGAGAGQQHPFMVQVARGFAARGVNVVTFDFPYMHQKRRVPDKAPILESCFRAVIQTVREWNPEISRRLFIGGKSMGGRIATHLAAAGLEGLIGTLALGYPLHPPGKPDQLRSKHLPAISTPVLIVQGERDAFGTPDELRPVLETMKAPVRLHVVSGGDHSLVVRGRSRDDVLADVLDVAAGWTVTPRVH